MVMHDSGYPSFSDAVEHLWIGLVPGHYTVRGVRFAEGRLSMISDAAVTLSEVQVGCSLSRVWDASLREPPENASLRLRSGSGLLLSEVLAYTRTGATGGRDSHRKQAMAAVCEHRMDGGQRGDTDRELSQRLQEGVDGLR